MHTTDTGLKRTAPAESGPTWKELARTYFRIGSVGFGGGFAVVELIHAELVEKHHWLSEQRFQNMMALSEMAPGALTVNLLAGIAYRLGGVGAMIISTAALLFPSFVLVLLMAGIFLTWQNNMIVRGAMEGLTAGVVGLLLAVVWDLIKKAPRHWCCLVVGLAALSLGLAFSLNPIWLVLMGGAAGPLKVGLGFFYQRRAASKSRAKRAG